MAIRSILLIINPNAGQATVAGFDAALHEALAKLPPPEQAIQVTQFVPDSPEQMRAVLREKFAQSPPDVLGVVGGDGSIMEALPLLVAFPAIQLALIPYGTGNLLAANLGIPADFGASLNLLFQGAPRRIDLGQINRHYFVLLAGAGVVADIMHNTPRAHKKRFGPLAYLINGIRTAWNARRARFKVIADGKTHRCKGVAVVVSNAASFLGPCLPLTPDATPDDGLLDVCIIQSRSNRDYFSTVMELLLKPQSANDADNNVISFRASRLRIECSKRLKAQADGNVIGHTPLDIAILPRRLQVLVPPETLTQSLADRQKAYEPSLLSLLQGMAPTL